MSTLEDTLDPPRAEMSIVVNHIRVRRMWKYVHMKAELTLDELAHLSDCESCMKLFKICVLAKTPSALDQEEETEQRREKSA
jgi:hypothetical protein